MIPPRFEMCHRVNHLEIEFTYSDERNCRTDNSDNSVEHDHTTIMDLSLIQPKSEVCKFISNFVMQKDNSAVNLTGKIYTQREFNLRISCIKTASQYNLLA